MKVSDNDKLVLRNLAEKVAEIATLPIQKETADLWRRMNGLEKVRPLIWIEETPWHEVNVNDELTLQCADEFCRKIETTLRREIYLWEHQRGDVVVDSKFYSPLAINDTGFGIDEKYNFVTTDTTSDIISREFIPQIKDEKDLEKIETPQITHDEEKSEETFQFINDIFGDILQVEKCGVLHRWFAPWDDLVRWWGVQEALTDLIMRPQLVHAAIDRLLNAHISRLDQLEEQNLLSQVGDNHRVGSGGPGITDELPQKDFDPKHVRAIDQWGSSTAQIFSDVSPAMHEEFALNYEIRWMERFGLNYYGCCEPLHHKIDIVKKIPRLRKISISPWANIEKSVEQIKDEYVISYKPNPAIFATEKFDIEKSRDNLKKTLEKMKGCVVEVIMKDISTVRYDPKRLWEWADMAKELAQEY